MHPAEGPCHRNRAECCRRRLETVYRRRWRRHYPRSDDRPPALCRGADLGDFTLAVIPSGTGNDWIRTAGIPADLSEAVKCIIAGKTAKEDIAKLTFENGVFCMANIGGIGLDATICYNTNALKEKGYKGSVLYSLVAPYSIFSKKLRPVEIVCDGETVYKGKLFTAVLANGIYRGGGLSWRSPSCRESTISRAFHR